MEFRCRLVVEHHGLKLGVEEKMVEMDYAEATEADVEESAVRELCMCTKPRKVG